MPGFPPLSRITESSLTFGLQNSLQRSLQSIAKHQRQISSGQRYATLADAPLATRRIVANTRYVERSEQFQRNISLASNRLAAGESALAGVQDLIVRAKEIALTEINGTSTAGTRNDALVEVSFLIDEIVTIANRQFGERSLFGGHVKSGAVFERVGSYVSYSGDAGGARVEIASGMFTEDAVSGVEAFGAWSSEIRGRTDLDPAITASTALSRLNGGRGVSGGQIDIRDGTARMIVDLSGLNTVGDVVTAINASGFVTAAVNAAGDGIDLTKAGANLSVLDVNGGTTATDLGLAQTAQGATLSGADLDPMIERITALADLAGGSGITAGTFTISNGGVTVTIDTAGMTTVEEVINAINRGGVHAFAEINSAGTGLNVISTLSGAGLSLSEGSSTTATELGLIIPSDEVGLNRLHGGLGVSTVSGADFRITLAAGGTLDIDISSASTLGDVADLINDDAANAGQMLAVVVAGQDRLRLTETTGAVGEFVVAEINGSFAAVNLGIDGTSSSGVLDGTGLQPGPHRVNSVFDGFSWLNDGLASNDVALINRALESLDQASTDVLQTRAAVGTSIRRLEISERRTALEIAETQEMISREGDTDFAQAIIDFQREQTVLQAALQTAGGILQQSILDFLG